MSRLAPSVAVLFLVMCCWAPTGFGKVHDIIWDIPADGLQLPSISTAKCGDTIRFRCPAHATHGVFKLEESNYNGTCPQSFEKSMIGEILSPPKQGCDFSITLTDGPDFYLTSQIPGACQKNLKVYVHAVCIKNDPIFASGLLSHVPALPSLRPSRKHGVPAEPTALPADGIAGLGMGSGVMGSPDQIGFAPAAGPKRRGAGHIPGHLVQESSEPTVLEQAKQSGAADARPALSKVASLVMAAAALALLL